METPEQTLTAAESFRAFQATREESDDLEKDLGYGAWGDQIGRGFIYLGALYIEKVGADWPEKARQEGAYHLIIANQEWISNDLEALEKRLFEYALLEGYKIPTTH